MSLRRTLVEPKDVMRGLASDSEIPLYSDLYREIASALTALGLNLSFFTFQTREHSSCSRQGKKGACPVLCVYLRHDADFIATGVSHHFNNWSDDWSLTETVREALNEVLRSHGCDENYVSDDAFIFLRTLEEEIFHNLGCVCKDAVRRAVQAHVPGAQIDRTYKNTVECIWWTGECYYVTFRGTADRERAERAKDRILNDVRQAFADADIGKACQSYEFEMMFGGPKGGFPMIDRDDICEDCW